ncbi:MAG TPA: methyltransferase domain-containing protein [Blastocatellia bacterium]|nr:methyltransferase domain-containing protein [Blastocatellia bacterium]
MRPKLLSLLICPHCQEPVTLHPFQSSSSDREDIEAGLLVCNGCGSPYPIAEGIPRMLPNAFQRLKKFRRQFSRELSSIEFRESQPGDVRRFEQLHQLTARAFGYEWNTYRVTSREEDLVTLFWLTGADPKLYDKLSVTDVFTFYPTEADLAKVDGSQLSGKTVLDIGCGMGKYLAIVSEYAETVVGLDLSEALVRARSNLKDRTNVHLVQGNILAPPLKAGFADFGYSVGVLHHTPDTHAAFLKSSTLIKPGGKLAVWLYPKEREPNPYSDWVHWVQDDLVRPVTCRMPPRVLRMFCSILGRLTFVRDRAVARHQVTKSRLSYQIAKYTGAVAVGSHRDPEIAAFLNFDWYSPQYRSYHLEEEVEDWYREAGFDNVRVLPQRVSAIGTRL